MTALAEAMERARAHVKADVVTLVPFCDECEANWPCDTAALLAEVGHTERLKAAILDIDAHATPLGVDADGFVTGGYLISVGCLHRALGVVGHSSVKCRDLPCTRAEAAEAEADRLRTALEELVACHDEAARLGRDYVAIMALVGRERDAWTTPAFMERLRANMARHKSLLDRLEALEHDEANQPRGPWRKSRG